RSETAASTANSAWFRKLEVSPSLNSLIGVTTAILIIILELNEMADGKAVCLVVDGTGIQKVMKVSMRYAARGCVVIWPKLRP
ncbi:hypothetical protein KQH43_31145, partial [Streptomyces sp. EL5]|nr:hypothetical protein [Streptomyces sp. EL5]